MRRLGEKNALTFQEIILRLNSFWAANGCLLWHPYSEKVGAGTMNPATVLRVLGPEPWNVGYAEPSYRPDDGRFGENPNRMQMHTQYQVILKPDPGDPQGTYLDSLRAIGIDTTQHDIRFVEDNWESPALGAWGLGWEVWLDGLEITQFTYFQQSASQVLPLPAVEITYGLERIAMFLQGVRQVWQLAWDGKHSYGDVLLQPEIEHCRYDFEVACIERLLEMYRLFEEEAKSAIGAGLTIPAHDYVLRCSHAFNILDARGAIGVTERAAYFARMRDLARQVAERYVKEREEAGFPWLAHVAKTTPGELPKPGPGLETAEDFVIEVGTEELPPQDLQSAIEQWKKAVPALLDQLRLSHGAVRVMGTPRRIVAYVETLAARQEDRVQEVKGPPASQAFDEQGRPTPAARGFAKGQGVAVESLQVKTLDRKSVVVAVKSEIGRGTAIVLSEALAGLISGIRFGKSMRWNGTGVTFSRPVRWLLALHGDQVLPFRYADLVSDRTTRGPRHTDTAALNVSSATDYLHQLEEQQVIVDRSERRKRVHDEVVKLAAAVGGHVPELPALLEEVTDLVEWPVGIVGGFDAAYLSLPPEVLTTVMKKHQRYFPVLGKNDDKLLPHFIAIVNGRGRDLDLVRQGNEDVLRARYADADYFVKQDRKERLQDFVPRLARLVFHEKLGSMLDKQKRVEQLSEALAGALRLSERQHHFANRAAALCKADLASSMVIEITALQGFMGREYARASGEDEEVAQAIFEHYLPRFAGDALPTSEVGVVVGLADRFDSLAGLFAAGLRPAGSADPFGVRRIALGLIQLLIERQVPLSLREWLAAAAEIQPFRGSDKDRTEAWTFLVDRLQGRLRDQGRPADVVTAVLAAQGDDPFRASLACVQLSEAVREPDWAETLTAYARCKRIVRSLNEVYSVAPELYVEQATRSLFERLQGVSPRMATHPDVPTLVAVLRELQGSINTFFSEVMVMAEDPAVKRARLGLVQAIAALPDRVADLSRLNNF